jgi:hypothetical protein
MTQVSAKNAVRRRFRDLRVELVRLERPCGNGQKRTRDHPAQCVHWQRRAYPFAPQSRERMIEQRCDKYSADDGQRFSKARRKQQGEQLGLVADLGDRNDYSRGEEGFHAELRAGRPSR